MVLRLDRDGMFWNVNRVINAIFVAESLGLKFRVRWKNSLYGEPGKGRPNTWLSYFRPVFPNVTLDEKPPVFNADKLRKKAGVPRLAGEKYHFQGKVFGLQPPQDRPRASEIIEHHIRLQPDIRALIDTFQNDHFAGPVIGLHIRGRGRSLAGGAGLMRYLLDPSEPIPYGAYFAAVDRALLQFPQARIFACSDSTEVLERCKEHYGDRVFSYDATRSAFGEMHCTTSQSEAVEMSPHKLGIDILIEAYGLANCDFFVHGNSNVANFVLCKSPDLPHDYVYQPVEAKYVELEKQRIISGDNTSDELPSDWSDPKSGMIRFRTQAAREKNGRSASGSR
ncbi:MAG: hypothetical protein HRU33_17730 [Rhodobacteraceae bacterium]|nr:hypothetical protein [Paracoccaceae bacterium]